MPRDTSDSSVRTLVDAETVEQSIHDLRTSLTAAYAHAQLLQRRYRRGEPSSPQSVDRAAGVISNSCTDMIQTLIDLEDACHRK